jgi:hypothetical protein
MTRATVECLVDETIARKPAVVLGACHPIDAIAART